MIRFSFDQLSSDHVYITGVTANFIYVLADDEGQPYRPDLTEPSHHLGFDVRRLRIHPRIGQEFMKYNAMRTFARPRLASINFYGDTVIGVEIQGYNVNEQRFDPPDEWRSIFDRALPEVLRHTEGRECYINGKEIFWIALDKNDEAHTFRLGTDDRLRLMAATGIALTDLSVSWWQRAAKASRKARKSAQVDSGNDSAALVAAKHGVVLAYSPDPDDASLVVYSPMLERRKDSRFGNRGEKKAGLDLDSETGAVFRLNSQTDPTYPNIEFLLYAAKTIGKLYGHDATDFLDIPQAIAQTGEVNLCAIERESRLNTPLHHLHILDCLAWLFGHIWRERDLTRMMDLSSMFRFIVSYGFIRESQITGLHRAGADLGELPLIRYESAAPVRGTRAPGRQTGIETVS